MRTIISLDIGHTHLTTVDNDAIALWRLDAFVQTGSLALPLVFPSANVHSSETYLLSYYVRPVTYLGGQGPLFAIFSPRYTSGLAPFITTGHIDFIVDQDGMSSPPFSTVPVTDMIHVIPG